MFDVHGESLWAGSKRQGDSYPWGKLVSGRALRRGGTSPAISAIFRGNHGNLREYLYFSNFRQVNKANHRVSDPL